MAPVRPRPAGSKRAVFSTILTVVIFAIMHTRITYAAQMTHFLAFVLGLSLLWGVLIYKLDSLRGAVIFHAADDCLVIFGAFTSM